MTGWLEKYRPGTLDDFWQQADSLDFVKKAIGAKQLPKLLICTGTYGVGKTSLARVIGKRYNCWNPGQHPYNPCGTCTACKNIQPSTGGTFVNHGYMEFDVTENSPAYIVKAIRENIGYRKIEALGTGCCYSQRIVCLDEIARVKSDMQERIIKLVENAKQAQFILCFSDPTAIIDPIRERGVFIELPLPTSSEATSALVRIAKAEGYVIDDFVAGQIAESVKRVPRRCVHALQQAALFSSPEAISLNNVA